MAQLFFVRDGSGPDHASATGGVDLEAVGHMFLNYKRMFRRNLPQFNSDQPASASAPFRYVVLRVGADETGQAFRKPGYYWIYGLRPLDCHLVLNLPEAPQS